MSETKPSIPEGTLIYTRSIETALGPRDVRLYWGNLASLIREDAVALVSASVFRPDNIGKAWRSLAERFPELVGADQALRKLVTAEPESALWTMSEDLQAHYDQYRDDFDPPAVWVSPELPARSMRPLRRVFVVRSIAKENSPSEEQDYNNQLRACFTAIRAQECADLIESPEATPYQRLVLSPLSLRQGNKRAVVLSELIAEACRWLKASPQWRAVDIAYWDEKDQAEDLTQLRGDLLQEIGDQPLGEPSEALHHLIKDLLNICRTLAQAIRGKPTKSKRQSAALCLALEDLETTLSRQDFTVRELGSSGGRLTEALVNWLCAELLNGYQAKDFYDGIERLGDRRSKKGNLRDLWLSNWFRSYLHTLRILRNVTVHSQSPEEGQFPLQPVEADLTVMVASLLRVLSLQNQLLEQQE